MLSHETAITVKTDRATRLCFTAVVFDQRAIRKANWRELAELSAEILPRASSALPRTLLRQGDKE